MSPEEAEAALTRSLARMKVAARRRSAPIKLGSRPESDDTEISGIGARLLAWFGPKNTG